MGFGTIDPACRQDAEMLHREHFRIEPSGPQSKEEILGSPTRWSFRPVNKTEQSSTVQIRKFCGILIFVLSALNFFLQFCKNVATAPERKENYITVATFFCSIQFCRAVFGWIWLEFKFFSIFVFFAFGLLSFGGGGYGSLILVPLKRTWGTLDFGIAVHSYTGIPMWISWTVGLQSIAQTSTNK